MKTESTREAMSLAMFKRWEDEEYRAHMSSPRPQHEDPSYGAVHGRVGRALRGTTSCAAEDSTCTTSRHSVWLWYDTPWEFVRAVGIGRTSRAIRWWSVRIEDYVLMCGRHHRLYDAGGLLFAPYTRDFRRAA